MRLLRLISLFAILLFSFSVQAQTTVTVPAGGDLQAAIVNAKRPTTILLQPGATYTGNFNLIDKGPCSGLESEYITITTSDPSGTPSALLGYPQFDVRPTTAMAAKMPVVRTPNAYPVFWINRNAGCYRIKGLNITSTIGSNTIRLIGVGEEGPRSIPEHPHHIIIEQNWLHPPEEDGSPMTAATVNRSVENGIYWEGTDLIVRQNAFTGFARKYPDGTIAATSNLLNSSWGNNIRFENNLSEAWTYAFFFGGGAGGWTKPEFTATVSNCTQLSCVFTNTNGLTTGVPVAIKVYDRTLNGVTMPYWGSTFVQSVVNNTVNFSKPLCNSDNTGGNGNSCEPFDSNNLAQIPADGNRAQWGGYQVQNVTVKNNRFVHRPEWTTYLGSSSGKGHFEIKACGTPGNGCKLIANVFDGSTGPTITVRNQDGGAPWNQASDFIYQHNYYPRCNSPFGGNFQDGGNSNVRSRNILYDNNLCVGQYIEPGSNEAVLSNSFAGADNLTLTRNTAVVANYRGFATFAPNVMKGLVMKDNIFPGVPNGCWDYSSGREVGALIATCWPGADVSGNVLFKIPEWRVDEVQHWWTTPYPNNTIVSSVAAVGFVAPDAGLTAAGNYRLADSSPFKGKGVNYPELIAWLGFDPNSGQPAPSPLPSASPTPVSSPSPQPSPSVSPTPQPSPVIIAGSQVEVVSRVNVREAPNITSNVRRIAEAGESGTTIGSTQVDTASGNTFAQVDFSAGVDGFVAVQFLKVVVVPLPSPTPTPVPTPVASPSPTPLPSPSSSPSPSPQPTPLPTPVSTIETTDEAWPATITEQRAKWKRLSEAGWKCTPVSGRIWCWRPRL